MHQPLSNSVDVSRGRKKSGNIRKDFVGCVPSCLRLPLWSILLAFVCCVDRALIVGGGAPEIETSMRLMEHARSLTGMDNYCVRAFAEALEVIPLTLAENAGLNPIAIVTELRNKHAQGQKNAGINVKKVGVCFCLCLFPFPYM